MVERSRAKLLSFLEKNHELKTEWMNSGAVFEDIWRCADFIDWCVFPKCADEFPVQEGDIRRVIFERSGLHVSRTVLKIAASMLGVPMKKTGNDYVFKFPMPLSVDALGMFQGFYDCESEVV